MQLDHLILNNVDNDVKCIDCIFQTSENVLNRESVSNALNN